MIYEITQELADELKDWTNHDTAWKDDDNKLYIADGDIDQFFEAGFDIHDYIDFHYSSTIKDLAVSIPSYKIHRYVENTKNVKNIDFTSEPFQFFEKEETIVKGQTETVTYYAEATMDANGTVTFIDPIVKETYTWLRNGMGFCYRKQTVIEWFYEDESLGPDIKNTGRFLSQVEMMEEGIKRRHRIVTGIQMPILQFMIMTMPMLPEDQNGDEATWEGQRQLRLIITGRNFLALHKTAFNNFGDESNKQILTDIANAPDTWLDNDISALTGVTGLTIRLYILDQLDVGSD